MSVAPENQGLSSLSGQGHWGPDGQQNLGRHMPERQVQENGDFDLAAQPSHHAGHVVALVMRRQFEIGELAQQNGFLRRQNTRVQKLSQHALNSVRVFVDIFQKQHAPLDGGPIRGSDQTAQNRQVPPPKDALLQMKRFFHGLVLWQRPSSALPLACEQIVKTREHDVVGLVFAAEISAQGGASPSRGARLANKAF